MYSDALHIEKLVKVYRTGLRAVDELSLTIPAGTFYGLLGPNGAGKSTTISCITGISVPTSGKIEVFGIDAVKDYKEARRRVGLSPQEFNIDFFGKVRDTLYYVAGYYGLNEKMRNARADELIERFGLSKYALTPFHQLSGGFKRRVGGALARAMVHDPDLLILDEPTAGVDVELRHELWKYLQELNQAGKTILLTSHYLEEVEKLCSHIGIINKGKMCLEDTKDNLIAGGKSLESVYLSVTKGEVSDSVSS
jgi:ABC-2 type transport system ATP-binding protein